MKRRPTVRIFCFVIEWVPKISIKITSLKDVKLTLGTILLAGSVYEILASEKIALGLLLVENGPLQLCTAILFVMWMLWESTRL